MASAVGEGRDIYRSKGRGREPNQSIEIGRMREIERGRESRREISGCNILIIEHSRIRY